uniref:Uncharacterized protein n=1 Tax=Timema poppense TaxID=170557 RepID=A0A7R9D324_TIMPO|nr:unnamed protein product [Timema poppensis]
MHVPDRSQILFTLTVAVTVVSWHDFLLRIPVNWTSSREAETTTRCDDELDFTEIVGFVTCLYGDFWWLACVLDSFEDKQEFKDKMEKSSSKPRSKLSRRHPSKQPSQTKTSQQESPKVRRKLNSQAPPPPLSLDSSLHPVLFSQPSAPSLTMPANHSPPPSLLPPAFICTTSSPHTVLLPPLSHTTSCIHPEQDVVWLNHDHGALLRVKSDDSISPTRKEDNNIKKNVTTTDMIQCEDKVSIPDFLLYPRPAGTEIEVTWDWDLSQRRASPKGVKQSDKVTHKNQTKSVPIVSKKVNSVPQILTSKPQTRQSAQGCRASESCNAVRTPDMAAINITLNIHDDSEKPLQPNFDSSNQSNNDGKSTTICRAGPNKAALRMGLLNENLSEYEKSLSLEDDGFIDPNLCTILDTVESNALTDVERLQCTPPDSSTLRGPQQGQASSPFHCTPEEIEIKRIQALQKLHQHSLSLNASKGDTKPPQAQRSSSPCDSKTRRMDRKTSPPQRYTPEEIERKKQEARSKLQLKQKQQALLRTNKLVNSSSISLVQHAKNIKYPP